MKRWARVLAWLAGLAFLGSYLRGTDLTAVGRALAGLGLWAPVLLLPYFVVYVVDTWAWRMAFARRLPVGFWRLFRIRWCGEAVNNVVPSAYVGGEALKVMLLERAGVGSVEAGAAALISKTAQTLAQVVFISAGALAFLTLAGEHTGLRRGMTWVLVGGVAVVAILLLWQRYGVFTSILGLLGRLRLASAWVESRRASWEAMDQTIRTFYREHRGRFFVCCLGFLAGWFLDTVEIYLASALLGHPLAWTQALAIEAFVGVVKVIGIWIPGSLGIQESGIVLLVRLAGGADTLGAVYALWRRARELVYALAGWGLLSLVGREARVPDAEKTRFTKLV